jgi:hypothetical protein
MSQPFAHILCLVGAPACGKSSLSQALQLLLQEQQHIQTIRLVSFDAVEAQLQPQSETSEFDVAAWRQVPLSPSLALNRTTHAAQSSRRPRRLDSSPLNRFANTLPLPLRPTSRSSSQTTRCICSRCGAASGPSRVNALLQSGANTALSQTLTHSNPYTVYLRNNPLLTRHLPPNHFFRSFVHISAETDVLLARNAARPNAVPVASLLKIAASLEPPLSSKHYFETPVLTLHCHHPPQQNAQIVAEWLSGLWQVSASSRFS